ncbi:hypothetical protein (plasmid) [Lactobacillus plantarum] [Lactiplantibacillus mudanjiangensis]|uniref:hypothetical protein n=1 Tax=Lactiplantibacillus mudanjiangensis TaxID=1296538 RepID=UPI001013F35B|nr:hypothetical protein [Lactiplantibacillus mudanjiangensis]VDG31691.1 hypothetical protein (plasmid) [Lactobacillus plantarum] [Lactiplantibacillus mudanjiangensis]
MNTNEHLYKMSEIAIAAGVDKTKVWRYIRDKSIQERSKRGNVLLYDEYSKRAILKGIKKNNIHRTTNRKYEQELIDTLRTQVDELKIELRQREKEIDNFQILLDQQQQLNLSTSRQNTKSKDNENISTLTKNKTFNWFRK